jgi:hypothetical protein
MWNVCTLLCPNYAINSWSVRSVTCYSDPPVSDIDYKTVGIVNELSVRNTIFQVNLLNQWSSENV